MKTVLSVDACTIGLEATLWQVVKDNGERRYIAYNSRKLKKAETKYAINDLEKLAIVHGVEQLKHFLSGRKFLLNRIMKP